MLGLGAVFVAGAGVSLFFFVLSFGRFTAVVPLIKSVIDGRFQLVAAIFSLGAVNLRLGRLVARLLLAVIYHCRDYKVTRALVSVIFASKKSASRRTKPGTSGANRLATGFGRGHSDRY